MLGDKIKGFSQEKEEDSKKSKYNLRPVEAVNRRVNIQITEVPGKKLIDSEGNI